MSLTKLIPSLLVATLAIGLVAAPAKAQNANANAGIVITDVDFPPGALKLVDGVLTATQGTISGTIAGLPFTTDIKNFSLDLVPGALPGQVCSILDLELGPIDIDLLGLHVDTSRICLNITAIEGGGLLGDLLCGLNLDLLEDLLGGLNLNALNLDGLGAVLSPVMADALADAAAPGAGADDICDGECEILDLALGPVDLTLLGLNVVLDDCEDGPVLVCVSASEGDGLLGDLLCGLAGGGGLLDLGDLQGLLGAILDGLNLDSIQDLIDAIVGGLDLNATDKQLNKIVKEVTKALRDGTLSNSELAKVSRLIGNLL